MDALDKKRRAGRRVRSRLGMDNYPDPYHGEKEPFADHTLTELWGTLFTRPGLTLREREMITLAVIIAGGGVFRNMAPHFRACMHLGLSDQQIREIIIQTMYYAGWPKGAAALHNYREVLAIDAKRASEQQTKSKPGGKRKARAVNR